MRGALHALLQHPGEAEGVLVVDPDRARHRAAQASRTSPGSRPSSASLPACARSVSAAAGRNGGRGVGPGGVEQLVLRAGARVERGEQLALALGAVGEVLGELAVGVPDRRAVAGAQQRQPEPAQALERRQVLAEPAGDEHAAPAEHRVAGEGGAAGDEREVVVGVARDRERAQRPERVAVGEHDVARVARRGDRRPAEPLAQGGDPLGVVLVVVRERDPAGAAARGTSAATASRCASSAGPGSMTQAGSRPSTQVLVPSSV